MHFLYPQLLFGLFALAIPIIIHLFNFRRTKKIYFSNTKFLKKVKEASSSKLRLKHYLILFSRLLAIFFLVLAFAQPYWTSGNHKSTQNEVVIYLDNSQSMTNEMANGVPAFNAAIGYVNTLLEVYPKGTSFKLITNDFESFSTSYKSASEIEEYLTSISISGQTRSSAEIASRVQRQYLSDSIDFYWLSDLQKTTLSSSPVIMDSLVSLNIVPLIFQNENNIYIDSIYLENPFMLGNEQLKLNVKVVNNGTSDINQMGIKVFLDEVQVATATMDINALSSQLISFNVGFDVSSENKGRISIEEYPVTFDNELFFVINKTKKIQILEIKSAISRGYVTNVYGNSALFDLTTYEDSNVDYSLIKTTDLVVLNGLEQISGALIRAIKNRLEDGKRVLIVPAAQVNITDYQLLFEEVSISNSSAEINLTAPDFDNPFFANVFEERNNRFAMPKAKPVLDLGNDRTALLKFQNGRPFLRFKDNIYIMASTLQPGTSTLQNHALFVPIMYGIATQSSGALGRLYYHLDDGLIVINTDSLLTDDVFKLKNDKVEIIPSQRMSSGKMTLDIPANGVKAGYYDLMLKDKSVTSLAFNNSSLESDLKQLSLNEIKEYFKSDFEIINASDELAFSQIVKSKYQGEPLWKWAILLCLLFLLMETLLIRYFP